MVVKCGLRLFAFEWFNLHWFIWMIVFMKHRNKKNTCNFIKKEALGQAFSCEFCEIFEITFLTEQLWTSA